MFSYAMILHTFTVSFRCISKVFVVKGVYNYRIFWRGREG